ncbi:MAG TPA: hypothetical protein VK273_09905 [Gaiellaceae bacterium]|nr:hypothetical protein [Gaiellaceae bacterium]
MIYGAASGAAGYATGDSLRARCWCTSLTTIEPSPTADATRPDRSAPSGLRAEKVAAIAERFVDSSFKDMLRDREFKRLSDSEVKALAEEFRRRAAHSRAEVDGVIQGASAAGGQRAR